MQVHADAGPDGTFTLENVPPGPYTLTVMLMQGLMGPDTMPSSGPPTVRDMLSRVPESVSMPIVDRRNNEMISMTDTRQAPWWIVPSDDKKRARVNCITHILAQIPYQRVPFDEPKLGKRQERPKGFVDDSTPRNVVPDVN